MLKPINILKYYLFGTFTMTFYIQLLEFSLPFWSTHTACNVRISISQLHCKHRLEHCPALKCISFTTGSYQVPDRVSITSPLFFYFVSSYIVPSLAIYNRKTVKNSLTKIITSIPTKVWSYSPTLNGTGFNVHQIGKYSSFFYHSAFLITSPVQTQQTYNIHMTQIHSKEHPVSYIHILVGAVQ